MKTVVVYSSQTGFTEKYAGWIAKETNAKLLSLAEAKKENAEIFDSADAVIYGGWIMGGKVVNSDWLKKQIPKWSGKKLVLLCVGASPNANPDVETEVEALLTEEEKKSVKAFYCQGGISYEKMKLPAKLAMKAFARVLKSKKDGTEKERSMGEMLSHSYDISDKALITPILEYLNS